MKPLALSLGLLLCHLHAASAAEVAFEHTPGKVIITVSGTPAAAYSYQDEKIPRPYFAHLRGPGGVPLTRTHPPVRGKDPDDHGTFHPGIWLAFGDLSGADSWRNSARVKHEKFVERPKGGAGKGTFAVSNLYLSADGKKTLCRETCRYTVLVRPAGYLLLWDSVFHPTAGGITFGDQEEMGLGVRIATPLTVKQGGRILTSGGHRNETQVRGKQAAWCDYGGTVAGGRRAGVTLMQHPKNFRPGWYHARDYGLLVVNPFGRKALTGGETSKVAVKQGETLRLRFGILLHASPAEKPADLAEAYRDYLKQSGEK